MMLPEGRQAALEDAFALLSCDGRDALMLLNERIEADLAAGHEVAALAQIPVLMAIEEIQAEFAAQSADELRNSARPRRVAPREPIAMP